MKLSLKNWLLAALLLAWRVQFCASGDNSLTLQAQSTTKSDGRTNLASASFRNPWLQFSLTELVAPKPKLKTAGVALSPGANASVYAGNLLFGGAYKRAKTPSFSAPAAISSFGMPQKGFAATLPSSGTSAETPKSAALKLQAGGFSAHAGAKLRGEGGKDESGGASLGSIRESLAEGEREYFGGIDWQPPGTRLFFSLVGGQYTLKPKSSSRWWLATPYFAERKVRYGIAEAFYTGEKLRVFSSNGISEDFFGRPRAYTRNVLQLNTRRTQSEAGVFLCDADYLNSEGTALRKTMGAYLHPQTKFVKLPAKLGKFRAGATASFSRSFSAERMPEETRLLNFGAAAVYEVGFFQFKPQFKLENANLGVGDSGSSEASASSGGGSTKFITLGEKSCRVHSLEIVFQPQAFGKGQSLGLQSEYKHFPRAEGKDQLSLSADGSAKLGESVRLSGSHAWLFKSSGDSFSLSSFKLNSSAQLYAANDWGKASLNLKFSSTLNLEKPKDSSTVFYCGVTLYIKP